MRPYLLLALSAALLAAAKEEPSFPAATTEAVTFAQIEPILEAKCFECHGARKQEHGLRLDVREAALLGGDSGPLFVAGKATESELVRRLVLSNAKHRMPYKADPLSDTQISQIMGWINQGAEWPDDGKTAKTVSDHWAFQKPVDPAIPAITGKTVANEIDSFVQAQLESQGIKPAPLADRHTLIRRLYLDLTGLPPTPEAVQAFVNDNSSEAYSTLVDSLLESPHFGEKWAQYWLDMARYADSDGYEKDLPRPNAYHWRDWLIRAINRDLPFDQFTVQQIAGDMLPGATDEIRLATGFSRNTLTNREGGVDREEFRSKSVADRTNTTMTAWMGLTAGCAECHTHKYDPLTQREYYGLFAVFNNSDERDIESEISDASRIAAFEKQLKDWQTKVEAQEAKVAAAKTGIAERLTKWEKQFQAPDSHWKKAEIIKTDANAVTLRVPLKTLTGLRIRARDGEPPELTLSAKPLDASHKSGDLLVDNSVLRNSQLVLRLSQTLSSKDVVGNALKNGTQDGATAVLNVYSDSPVPQPGVATGAKVMTMAAKGAAVTYFHLRPQGEGTLSVIAAESFKAGSKTGIQTVTFKTPWKMQPGDLFAHYGNGGPLFTTAAKGLKDVIYYPVKAAPKQGETITLSKLKRFGVRHYSMQLLFMPDTDAEKLIPAVWGDSGAELTLRAKDGKALPGLEIALTDNTTPMGKVGKLPAKIATILAISADQRSEAQAKELLAHYTPLDAPVKKAQKARDGLNKKKPKKPTIKYHVMAASKPRATHVHKRGNFMDKGAKVSLHTPSFLHPLKARGAQPDRLDFARWLVDADNPLMPRVTANQVWAELFGRGLVKTVEDFGTQGETPSHPELLDWLAKEWRRLGWSRKALIRKIVHSHTYRQSSVTRAELQASDPENLSLAHQNRFRLRAELVRDQYLAVAGLLNRKVGGPSFRPPLPQSVKAVQFVNKWTDSKGDDLYRRAMYIHLQRNLMLPMLMTFDHPDSIMSCTRRERSNTPLQALTLLNGSMFVESARALAASVSKEADVDRGIDALFLRTSARQASDQERQRVRASFDALQAHYAADPAAAKQCLGSTPFAVPDADAAAWVAVSRAVLNLDEMITRE
jgi:mono/diheme cytochrome c family protein